MKNSNKKKSIPGPTRRKFLKQLGVGTLAATTLSSSNLVGDEKNVNFDSGEKPSKKDIQKLIQASLPPHTYEKISSTFKEAVSKIKNPSAEVLHLVSDENFQKIIKEQEDHLHKVYAETFTRAEVLRLTDFYQSELRRKFDLINIAQNDNPETASPMKRYLSEVPVEIKKCMVLTARGLKKSTSGVS